MTYRGIKHRLNLPNDYDIESLVEERGELFRPKVPNERLNEWKTAMQAKITQRPAWIRDLGDETLQLRAVAALSVDDVFRSQFRIHKERNRAEEDVPASKLELIDWGLQHIERLRNADLEAREEAIKRWQLWSVILLSVINIVVTLLKK
ncbi:hypothetical protein H6F86_23285 [Phormidium sp. FACHB-592]|uniref:Uncharacterized protein n=1 Tax=Stenomitos frigidus AS-A4 TaxID=2933935 RepID=A0ABV0KRA2_9CYAN|nr:hypothetical protein [Phormidium sp. FACHB-592]MBD2076755.1 hypothetical protein [Phormidium sp. FACHB-592]